MFFILPSMHKCVHHTCLRGGCADSSASSERPVFLSCRSTLIYVVLAFPTVWLSLIPRSRLPRCASSDCHSATEYQHFYSCNLFYKSTGLPGVGIYLIKLHGERCGKACLGPSYTTTPPPTFSSFSSSNYFSFSVLIHSIVKPETLPGRRSCVLFCFVFSLSSCLNQPRA